MSTLTLIILIANVFLIGVIAAVTAYFVRAHYQQKDNVVKPKQNMPEPDFPKLQIPKEIIDRITKESEEHYRRVVTNSATYMQQGLVESATDMNNHVKNMVSQIIDEELTQYRQEMDKMRQQAEAQVGGVQAEMDSHKEELRAQLAKDIEAEKQQLLKQIDTKLSDAVASFLIEALGHNVDLGNQSDYLTSLLEEHKADFVKEVAADRSDEKAEDQEPKAEPATDQGSAEPVTVTPQPEQAHEAQAAESHSIEVQEDGTMKEVPSEAKTAE